MEALVPAFIAALLCQATDRSAWLAAILADRYGRPFTVALMALLAHSLGNCAAAFGALVIAPALTPNARNLLLALALVMGGIDGIWRLKTPDRLEGWRIGPVFTPLLGMLVLALGDRTQFFTLAFAARSTLPWMAAAGAIAGVFVVHLIAAYCGELGWRSLPLRALRIVTGLCSLGGGLVVGLSALRLI